MSNEMEMTIVKLLGHFLNIEDIYSLNLFCTKRKIKTWKWTWTSFVKDIKNWIFNQMHDYNMKLLSSARFWFIKVWKNRKAERTGTIHQNRVSERFGYCYYGLSLGYFSTWNCQVRPFIVVKEMQCPSPVSDRVEDDLGMSRVIQIFEPWADMPKSGLA